MIRILGQIGITLSTSASLSLVVEGTAVLALGLMTAWLFRRGRAAVRHAVLASAFGVLLALPMVSWVARPVMISVPVAASDSGVPWVDSNLLSSPGETTSALRGSAL